MKERRIYPSDYEEQINVNGEVVRADQIFQLVPNSHFIDYQTLYPY